MPRVPLITAVECTPSVGAYAAVQPRERTFVPPPYPKIRRDFALPDAVSYCNPSRSLRLIYAGSSGFIARTCGDVRRKPRFDAKFRTLLNKPSGGIFADRALDSRGIQGRESRPRCLLHANIGAAEAHTRRVESHRSHFDRKARGVGAI